MNSSISFHCRFILLNQNGTILIISSMILNSFCQLLSRTRYVKSRCTHRLMRGYATLLIGHTTRHDKHALYMYGMLRDDDDDIIDMTVFIYYKSKKLLRKHCPLEFRGKGTYMHYSSKFYIKILYVGNFTCLTMEFADRLPESAIVQLFIYFQM